MTQPHLLEQAKQGDPQAIAALMNKSLQPKGMTAYVDRQGDHLEVVLKSDRIPNRQALTAFVEQGIHNLGIETIKSVTISGQQIGATASAWSQQLYLDPLIPGFEPDASDLTETTSDFDQEIGASLNDSEPSMSQLHDLLSDQSEPSFVDPQRQELESRLESLWVEQSEEQSQDFLSELMAEEPQDATRQFEEFLTEQPDDQFQGDRFRSTEQEGLWNGSSGLESEDLLADLNLEDSKQALTEQLQETPYNWREISEESDDAPDEILYSFMEDQPQVPADLGFDETGEPTDEPDEILPDFLDSSSDGSLDSLFEHSSNNSAAEFQSQPEPPIDFLNELPEEETQGLGISEGQYTEADDEEFLDLLAESDEEQEQGLLWELTGDNDNASSIENLNAESDAESGQMGEFSFNASPDLSNELSLGIEEEPNSSFTDFSASESPDASINATSQSWEDVPIEFLQSELEPLPPEMPTEQFDEPLVDLTMEPSFDDPARPADFPPDFLQESSADQSDDLFVESQTNPFIEQMEEQDRDQLQKPENRPSEDFNQFDQTEWLLDDADPNAPRSQGLNEPQSADDSALDSELLSDEALINFFAEDSDAASTGTEFSEFSDEETGFADYRTRPDNPDESIDQSVSSDFDLGDAYSFGDLSDRQGQPEDSYDLSLESDEPELIDPYADSYNADPYAGSSNEPETSSGYYSDTEIPAPVYPGGSVADTQIPAYQEPSSEDLEQQVAEIYPESNDAASRASSEVVEAPSDSRGSPWLFPLILLGISGWIVGLISFAFLWSRLSSPPPETAGTPSDVVASPNVAPTACPPTTQATGNVPIALSELQFQQNASNPQQVNLTGCVTNRTQQPIDIVSIGYRSGTAGSSTVGGLSFSNSVIQPGQTVPFTSKFTLPSDTNNVSIGTVYWQPAGQTTSREANTSINLNR